MSRSGYYDDCDDMWAHIRWRGAVTSAMNGKRGQAFLRELLAALDALPQKRLIEGELQEPTGEVCALGAVARARGMSVEKIDPYEPDQVCGAFGIAEALGREIMFWNDDVENTPEKRFELVRSWVANAIIVRPEELL